MSPKMLCKPLSLGRIFFKSSFYSFEKKKLCLDQGIKKTFEKSSVLATLSQQRDPLVDITD